MNRDDTPAVDLGSFESWFADNGLAYFADPVREKVSGRFHSRRLWPSLVLIGAGSAGLAWLAGGDLGTKLVFFVPILVFAAVGYLVWSLRLPAIARWAAAHTFASLNLMVKLATRALPMLLLFMTFLFINTEVWQVAAELDGRVMGAVVLLFLAAAVLFLVGRIPEEVDVFAAELDTERVQSAVRGTPAEAWVALDRTHGMDEPLGRWERANLVMVMLISQLIQVLLLSLTVFVFFVVFGAVAIDDKVIQAWIQDPPTAVWGQVVVSRELLQVSGFLTAFAGLYFTVYAVTDEQYREHFFNEIIGQLERAVSVREIYRAIQRSRS